jgi:hypothetical protein
MAKTWLLIALLTFSLFQARAQTADSSDRVLIYFVTHPGGLMTGVGRFFAFRSDTFCVWNNKGWLSDPKEGVDTTYYTLTNIEKDSILKILKSPDTLKSAFNPCIMDGLILWFSYEKANKKYTAWVSNAYDNKLFTFIDIINKYVPKQFRIPYDKDELIRITTECYTNLHK